MDNRKSVAFRLPCKCNYLVILIVKLKYLYWNISFLDTEELKTSIGALLCFGVPVNLDSKVLSIALPTHFAIADTKKVFLP